MINAVAYIRGSSEKSINTQLIAIKDYAKRNSLMLIDIYIDGVRGSMTYTRKEFEKMITDSESGIFKFIIVNELSRLTRDKRDATINSYTLKENGVIIVSVKEPTNHIRNNSNSK